MEPFLGEGGGLARGAASTPPRKLKARPPLHPQNKLLLGAKKFTAAVLSRNKKSPRANAKPQTLDSPRGDKYLTPTSPRPMGGSPGVSPMSASSEPATFPSPRMAEPPQRKGASEDVIRDLSEDIARVESRECDDDDDEAEGFGDSEVWCSGVTGRGGKGKGKGRKPPPPLSWAPSLCMPSHCPPNAKCQAQRHL